MRLPDLAGSARASRGSARAETLNAMLNGGTVSAVLNRRPLLEAPTPHEWLDTWLPTYFAAHEEGEPAFGHRWVGVGEVSDPAGQFLEEAHQRILDTEGGTPQMAAKWLADWVAGGVAGVVGFVLAAGSAGLLADTATLRWRIHPDGWVDRVELGDPEVVVAADHPWAGLAGVHVVDDDEMVVARTVRSLVVALSPAVEGMRALARVGTRSLWVEVADGLAMSVAYQPHLPVNEHALDLLRLASLVPDAPWPRTPDLRIGNTASGPAYLGRKAGCCLAYQLPRVEQAPTEELDAEHGAYLEAFPPEDGPRYCATCSLRNLTACEERQAWWLNRRRT